MKKLLLAFLLFAGIATCFSGCNKEKEAEDDPSTPTAPTYTNTFSIGDDTYNVALAGLIENISFGGITVNVLAMASDGLTSTSNNTMCIVYFGEVATGTSQIAPGQSPIVLAFKDFNLQELIQDTTGMAALSKAYSAISGSLTVEISGDKYTVTTKNLKLTKENAIFNGNIDYSGNVEKIELSAGSGSITLNNDVYQIFKAGTLYKEYLGNNQHLLGFISEDMTKLVALIIGETIPEGNLTIPTQPLILIKDLDISTMGGTPIFATSGNISITKTDDSNYQVVITDVVLGDNQLSLEYTGTIPELSL